MNESLYELIHKDNKVMDRALSLFHILSSGTRLKILLLLCMKEMNVKELEHHIEQSQSAVSHQLSLLRKEKLVTANKIGREQYYRVADNHVELILNMAITHVREELK